MTRMFFLFLALTNSAFSAEALPRPAELRKPAEVHGLAGAWNFDEAKGAKSEDTSAQKNIGTLAAGVQRIADGKFGAAIQLDGSSGHVRLRKSVSDALGGTASLAAWIRTRADGAPGMHEAPAIAGAISAFAGDSIVWGSINEDGRIGVQAGGIPGALSASPINDGRWHHVVFTRNKDNGETRVFVDGQPGVAEFSDAGFKAAEIVALGRVDSAGGESIFLHAQLDEVRLFSRALTQSDVNVLFTGNDRKSTERLVAIKEKSDEDVAEHSDEKKSTDGATGESRETLPADKPDLEKSAGKDEGELDRLSPGEHERQDTQLIDVKSKKDDDEDDSERTRVRPEKAKPLKRRLLE